jgi:hypothetical protein
MSNDNYFDLTVSGTGYINRFRKVTPDEGKPYYSVTIAAMRGKSNSQGHIKKTYVDCNVVGAAIEMCQQLETFFEGDNEPKVLVGFMFGDLEQRAFPYQRGERKGQTGYALKGRLFDIKWYKINGNDTVYSPAEIERKKLAESQSDNHQTASDADDDQPQPSQTDAFLNQLPSEVKLVKDDPYYDEREKQLIAQGYQYVGGEIWSLAGAA